MPRWSPCQAPPPPSFTSFAAVLHLGSDFAKTLASPSEAVCLCIPTHCQVLHYQEPHSDVPRFAQRRPPSVICLQLTHSQKTFSDRLRRHAVLGLLFRCGSGFLSHTPILHTHSSHTQSSPRHTSILQVWQRVPCLAGRGDRELDKRVQTGLVTHRRHKQLLVWTCTQHATVCCSSVC